MIVSSANETIKMVVSLKDKKYRQKYNKYVIEGLKLAEEIIDSRGKIPFEFILYCENIVSTIKGYKSLKDKIDKIDKIDSKKIIEVSEEVFKKLTDTVTPQGVLVVLPIVQKTYNDFKYAVSSKENRFAILDSVQDAGNLGTIIRSAISFDVRNIICTKGTVDVYSPKVIRSTMGAIEKVNIFYEDNKTCIEEYIKLLKENKYNIIATTLDTNNRLSDLKNSKQNVYVLGNEANGVSEDLKKLSDKQIKIEMEDTQESLNVGQAATICMYREYISKNNK